MAKRLCATVESGGHLLRFGVALGAVDVKAAPFEYLRPATLGETTSALVANPGGKVLAGGQSLLPLLAFRLLRPTCLVDVSRIPELLALEVEANGILIGAAVTHRRVELNVEIRSSYPIIAEGLAQLGHVAIRNTGTVGGSLAHADPAAEWPALALALDGVLDISGPSGRRSVAADRFFVDWMTPDLAADEVLTSIRLSHPPPGSGGAFEEIARRKGDFALAGAATVLTIDKGVISRARVSVVGGGLTPLRLRETEAALVGNAATNSVIASAADLAAEVLSPLDDQHATAEYRRRVAVVMIRRALERSLVQALFV